MSERSKEFEVRELAKVLWMFGRAHYNNETVAGLVQTLAKRALAPSASAQVCPSFLSIALPPSFWAPRMLALRPGRHDRGLHAARGMMIADDRAYPASTFPCGPPARALPQSTR